MSNKASRDFRNFKPYLGKSVLEVGPGYGHLASLLVEAGVTLSLCDVIPDYLVRLENMDNVTTMVADAQELGVTSSFDLVILCDVLEHVFRPSDVLFWVYSALKPGGYAYIRVPSFEANLFYSRNYGYPYELVHLRTYTPSLLTSEVLAAGFRVIRRATGFSANQRVPLNATPGVKTYWNLKRIYLDANFTSKSVNFSPLTKIVGVLLDGAFGIKNSLSINLYRFFYRFVSKPSEIFIVIQKPI